MRLGSAESAVDAALLAAVQSDPDYTAGKARVLVFTRNTANADRVSHRVVSAGTVLYCGSLLGCQDA